MAFSIDPGTGGWAALAAGAGAGALKLFQALSSFKVERAADNAQVNVIETLQAERDAALKRADEAQAQLMVAVEAMGQLRAEIAGLRENVKNLSEQVQTLKNAGAAK
ncbi:hypothetical protein AB4076_10995 [Dyella sp. 2RAF44]|uniref:hypothetical protein n=1 Tax=Dyella sp. 2RAF44 TaxID=3233000 RepID=UPI003F920F48